MGVVKDSHGECEENREKVVATLFRINTNFVLKKKCSTEQKISIE